MVVTVGSENAEHPWAMTASMKPTRDGYRSIAFEARQVAASDLLLATRIDDGSMQTNLPLSASLRGEIGPDGVPQSLAGRIVADAGFISDSDEFRRPHRHRPRRIQDQLGCRKPSALGAVPDFVRRQPHHADGRGSGAAAIAGGPWTFRVGGGTIVLNVRSIRPIH